VVELLEEAGVEEHLVVEATAAEEEEEMIEAVVIHVEEGTVAVRRVEDHPGEEEIVGEEATEEEAIEEDAAGTTHMECKDQMITAEEIGMAETTAIATTIEAMVEIVTTVEALVEIVITVEAMVETETIDVITEAGIMESKVVTRKEVVTREKVAVGKENSQQNWSNFQSQPQMLTTRVFEN